MVRNQLNEVVLVDSVLDYISVLSKVNVRSRRYEIHLRSGKLVVKLFALVALIVCLIALLEPDLYVSKVLRAIVALNVQRISLRAEERFLNTLPSPEVLHIGVEDWVIDEALCLVINT